VTAQVWAALAGGAAAGAVLTALATLFTGWLTRRHENRRWLLDKRLEAYVDFNRALNAYHLTWSSIVHTEHPDVTPMTKALAALNDCEDRVRLLAPPATVDKSSGIVGLVGRTGNALMPEKRRFSTESVAVSDMLLKTTLEEGRLLLDLQSRDVQGTGWAARIRQRLNAR
jgi:hypothetical protein